MRTLPARTFAFILLMTCLLTVPLVARAATMTLTAGSVEAPAGGTVPVPIQATGAPGVGALHLELTYDAKVLQPQTVDKGTLASSNALLDSNTTQPGRIVIGLISLDAIKGDGALANVTFKVIGDAGTSSALNIENAQAWESGTHAEILVKTEPGKITVASASPSLLLYVGIGLLALLVLLLIIFLLSRRRRPAPQAAAPAPGYYYPPPPPGPPPSGAAAPPPANTPPPTTPPRPKPTDLPK